MPIYDYEYNKRDQNWVIVNRQSKDIVAYSTNKYYVNKLVELLNSN